MDIIEFLDVLTARLGCNAVYLACLERLRQIEPEYVAFYEGLTPEEQALLDRYISICEEIDDMMCREAYELGKRGND